MDAIGAEMMILSLFDFMTKDNVRNDAANTGIGFKKRIKIMKLPNSKDSIINGTDSIDNGDSDLGDDDAVHTTDTANDNATGNTTTNPNPHINKFRLLNMSYD